MRGLTPTQAPEVLFEDTTSPVPMWVDPEKEPTVRIYVIGGAFSVRPTLWQHTRIWVAAALSALAWVPHWAACGCSWVSRIIERASWKVTP